MISDVVNAPAAMRIFAGVAVACVFEIRRRSVASLAAASFCPGGSSQARRNCGLRSGSDVGP
jgi:uncharacterized membrane protein